MCSSSLVTHTGVSAYNLVQTDAPYLLLDTVCLVEDNSKGPPQNQPSPSSVVRLNVRPSWNKGMMVSIEAYVVDHLPSQLDLLLSYIRQLGVFVNLNQDQASAPATYPLAANLDVSLHTQLSKVGQLLVHRVLKQQPLPGARPRGPPPTWV